MTDTFGSIDPSRLGSGDPTAVKVLHGDGVWRVPETPTTPPGTTPLVYAQQTVQAGDTVANTTSATTIASKYTIPTADFVVGRVFRVTARGLMRNNASTPTTTVELLAGSTVLGTMTVVHLSNATLRGWELAADLIVLAIGASGSVEAQGGFLWQRTAAGEGLDFTMSNSAAVTLDTTADRDLALRVTWSVANANNTITMRQLIVEMLGPP